MIVVVIVLSLVAVVATAVVVVTRQRLIEQRRLTAAAALLATQRAVEIEVRDAALRTAEQQRADADERAEASRAAAALAAQEQVVAEAEAASAVAAGDAAKLVANAAKLAADEARQAADEARQAADEASSARTDAEERATAADQRAAEAASVGIDPHVLWALERHRSDRTWRFSVAIGPETRSVFDDVEHPLVEALRVEVAATREEAGTVVELDVDLSVPVTSAGSLLTLRAAQELLADVVRRAEQVVLTVGHDGKDVVVTVAAIDEHGVSIELAPLDTPPTLGLVAVPGGVRVVGAVVVV